MNAKQNDLEVIETALSELNQWRIANVDKAGTPQFARTTNVHHDLTDLIAAGGGTPEQRAEVMRRRRVMASFDLLTKSEKRKVVGIVAQIERHKTAIAKHRDALRDIYEDLEAVLESSDTGLRSLDEAVAVLSEYV